MIQQAGPQAARISGLPGKRVDGCPGEPVPRAGARPVPCHRVFGRARGGKGSSWSCPFRSPVACLSTSFRAAGRSPIGSQTTSRASSDTRRRICRPGYTCLSKRTSRVKTATAVLLHCSSGTPAATRPRRPRACPGTSPAPSRPPAGFDQPGNARDTRPVRRDLVSDARDVGSIGGRPAPRRPLMPVPTRPGRHVTSTDGDTLSGVREGCGERAQYRRSALVSATPVRRSADADQGYLRAVSVPVYGSRARPCGTCAAFGYLTG